MLWFFTLWPATATAVVAVAAVVVVALAVAVTVFYALGSHGCGCGCGCGCCGCGHRGFTPLSKKTGAGLTVHSGTQRALNPGRAAGRV